MLKRIKRWFLSGLLMVAPVGVTLFVIAWALAKVDGLLNPIQAAILRTVFGEERATELFGERLAVPGAGLVVICLLVLFVGFLASNLATRGIAALPERLLRRLPLVKLLYNSLRDLFEAFVGDKRSFDRPVLVRLLPGSEARLIGFVTNRDLGALGVRDRVAVYLPQSYNFGGLTVLVPADLVSPLECDSGQVMAFVMSGGVSLKLPAPLPVPAPGDVGQSGAAGGHRGRPGA